MQKLLPLEKKPRKVKKALHPLEHICIEVTHRCNFRCVYCVADAGSVAEKNELPTEKILSLLYQARRIGVKSVLFTGGEPFIREDLHLLLKEAKRLGYARITVFTNGALIKKEDVHILKRIKANLQISLDGADPKTHDKLCGVFGAFKKITETIQLLLKNKVQVSIATTITHENFGEIPKILKLARKWRIPWRGGPVVLGGRARMKHLDPVTRKVLKEGIPIVDLKLPRPKIFKYVPCLAGFTGMTVFPNGNVGLCPAVRDIIFGNIRTQLLSEIWEERFGAWQRSIDMSKRGECSSCKYLPMCSGACYAGGCFLKPEEIGKRPSPTTCSWIKYGMHAFFTGRCGRGKVGVKK